MEIVIKGTPKEIAALIAELQEQPKVDAEKICQSLTSALDINYHPYNQNRCDGAVLSNLDAEQQLVKHLVARYAEELEQVRQKGRSHRR